MTPKQLKTFSKEEIQELIADCRSHIDGDRYNNLLENLRLLCPNCHSQTPTFRGRNIAIKEE